MSQKEDVIFCKIAITNGLVTEEQAQKVLSICQKRENEQGRRPPIGDVFAKYNLMKSQDVRRIYEAVSKRTGKPVPQSSSVGRGNGKTTTIRKTGATTARFRRSDLASEREPKASRGIDPTTLWMGISGGVVFVAVVFFILYLVFVTPATNAPEKQSTLASESTAPAPELPKVPAANPAGVPAAPKATEKPKEVAKESVKSLSRERRNEIDAAIADAKAELNPHDGLKILENLKKDLEGKNFEPPENLLQAIAQLEEAAKQAPKPTEADSSSPPAAEPEAAAEPEKDSGAEKENTDSPEPKEENGSKEPDSGDGK